MLLYSNILNYLHVYIYIYIFILYIQPRTPLEQEIATLLHGSDHVLPNNKVLTRAEERALKAMSLEEVCVLMLDINSNILVQI